MEIDHPANEGELRRALTLLLARPDSPAAEVDCDVDSLLRRVRKRGLGLQHCLIARSGRRAVSACLCVDAAGGASSVLLPPMGSAGEGRRAARLLLDRCAGEAATRGVQFLQAMVAPEADDLAEVLAEAGFQHLARLIYLETDLTQRILSGKPAPEVSWEAYGEDNHRLFTSVVAGTYEASLDCAGLNGRRHIDDILASHRATGRFQPDLWCIARVDGVAAGVLLLAHMPDRWCCEVAYVGLLPPWRGRGYGAPLMSKAVQLAREQAVSTLTLTVDEKNHFARKLYETFGFCETARRDAWVNFVADADPPPLLAS